MEMIRIASFDIGLINFAWCVEETYVEDGVSRERVLSLVRADLTAGADRKQACDIRILLNLTQLLDAHAHLWDGCHVVVVEQQMAFTARHNPGAVRVMHHCMSYFHLLYGATKRVQAFPSTYKTRIRGPLPPGVHKKKWVVHETRRILAERDDTETRAVLEAYAPKQDDVADAFMQLQAWKHMSGMNTLFAPV
jgi:hypothetical protein